MPDVAVVMNYIMNKGYKRIATNTIFVYVRLFLNICVGLITSRFVLKALGSSDYGLYTVVAGVLSMLSFLSSSMSQTTIRFLNFEKGKEDGDLNKIFNVCQNIHVVLTVVVLVIAETLGVYYINNILNVDPSKIKDAMFCFQVSTIVACLGILNVPYVGLLNVYEKFKTIAIVDVSNTILKLLLVLSLCLFQDNVLRVYALFMSLMTLVSFISYHIICFKKWPFVIKINFKKTKGCYKDIVIHNNYNTLLSASLILRDQGSNMIINFFFGTVVNAAYAIARLLLSYVNMLAGNFDAASAPQIVQNLANSNQEASELLVNKIGRFSTLISIVGVFILAPELDFILHLWLGDIPNGTLEFSYVILALVIVSATSSGLSQFIQAVGKLKWFNISFFILYFSCLPLSVLFFKLGAEPVIIIILFLIADIISRCIQLLLLKKYSGFKVLRHIKEAYFKPFIILLIMIVFVIVVNRFIPDSLIFSVINIIVTTSLVLMLCLFIGIRKTERYVIVEGIKSKFFSK